jgi:hypothetical protein
LADDVSRIAGCWILKSCHVERVDTGERMLPYGESPRGTLIMHESGRMAAVITPRDQVMPASDADTAKIYGQLIAYSGRYRLEGNRFVTDVDVSWLPAWVGTAQGRTFDLRQNVLEIVSDPTTSPLAGGAQIVAVLTWVREASP